MTELPQNAAEFMERASEIVFHDIFPGMTWTDYEASRQANRCRNLVGRILAIPGSEHYHGYQKTSGDFGILRDETGEDIDVAFAVGNITFLVSDEENKVEILEAVGPTWSRQAPFDVVVVAEHISKLFEIVHGSDAEHNFHNDEPLELSQEMEVKALLSDAIDKPLIDVIAAQYEGEDIFVLGSRDDTFKQDLASVINRHSIENQSNTPDFILADFAARALALFADTSRARERWYGKSLSIGQADDKPIWFVGGYSLQLLEDQKIKVTNYDNSTFELKVKQIVDFLDRRASPNERPLDPTHGN